MTKHLMLLELNTMCSLHKKICSKTCTVRSKTRTVTFTELTKSVCLCQSLCPPDLKIPSSFSKPRYCLFPVYT